MYQREVTYNEPVLSKYMFRPYLEVEIYIEMRPMPSYRVVESSPEIVTQKVLAVYTPTGKLYILGGHKKVWEYEYSGVAIK